MREFFPTVNNVSWYQAAFDCGTRTPRTRHQWLWCWWSRGHCLWIPACPGCTGTTRNPSFSLEWKSEKRTKHYLSLILLDINWCNWQAGKNSRLRMKVQGLLIQARFIEIHQVFAKKSHAFLTEWYFTSKSPELVEVCDLNHLKYFLGLMCLRKTSGIESWPTSWEIQTPSRVVYVLHKLVTCVSLKI